MSCNNEVKKTNPANVETEKTIFLEENKLFLNLYSGMTTIQYDEALLASYENKKLKYVEDNLFVKDVEIMSENYSKYRPGLMYPLLIKGNKYFMSISSNFDNGGLVSINLSGPSTPYSSTKESFKKDILALYTRKYGKPKVLSREKNSLENFFSSGKKINLTSYIFKNQHVAIEFFEEKGTYYNINYMELEYYNRQKLNRKKFKENKEKQQIKSEKDTYSDI